MRYPGAYLRSEVPAMQRGLHSLRAWFGISLSYALMQSPSAQNDSFSEYS